MKKIKRILLSVVIAIFAIVGISNYNYVNAETAGPLYLGIISLRDSGYGYKQNGKKVWKIAQYESSTGTTPDTSKLIYCIKAGAGFGSENSETVIKAYSQKFDLKDTSKIPAPYSTSIPTDENYSRLMWVLNNMYTKISNQNSSEESRNEFLKNAIPNEIYEVLTDDDIDVIQQLAIWYFTNPSGEYHYDNIILNTNSTKNVDADYKAFEDIYGTEYEDSGETVGQVRQEAARALYRYFIDNSTSTSGTPTANKCPISLTKNSAEMKKIDSNYVAGPYKFTEEEGATNYNLTATYKNYGTDDQITPTIAVKNLEGNIVETTKTLKELVGTEFYLVMPVSSNISGIEMNAVCAYTNRTITYWSVENAPSTEQPVVIIEDESPKVSLDASIIVPEEKPFDLSLRKFITSINGSTVSPSREPVVDTSKLAANTATTATYNHPKTTVKVAMGDIVTYTIRVYNEGKVDGYASEITDHLPKQLEYIVDDEINKQYKWKLSPDMRTVTTNYLSKNEETSTGEFLISAFDGGSTLSYKDVKIRCKVISTTPMANRITNIAEITNETDENAESVKDRDSTPNNVVLPTNSDLENYKNQEVARGEEYIPGQQDDDDFEKLALKEFDLALKKFIVGVNDTEIKTQAPTYNTNTLKAGQDDATYTLAKDPIAVELGDTVIYTIRIYNEAETDGYADEITDYLPDQLEFIEDNEINKKYEWSVDGSNSKKIKTAYLSFANDGKKNEFETATRNNKIAAFDGGDTLSYKDIQVACKVISEAESIRNIAEITKDKDGNGNEIIDRDSTPDNVKTEDYTNNQEDDDDYAKLKLKKFDLALRKFITSVNGKEITDRIPQIVPNSITALKDGTVTTLEYNHTKEPLKVALGDTVVYTIRVYNEGEVDGYATEISDYLPDGLEFIKDSKLNKDYGWTVDESNSRLIKTTYLSKDEENESRSNLIKAFDGKQLSYKDVKVEGKVVTGTKTEKKVTNIAEISKSTNDQGKESTDRDSETDNVKIPSDLPGYKDDEIQKPYVPGQEDDDDFEKILIQEFDLALQKFITAVNTTDITSRYPKFEINSDGKFVYTGETTPVIVTNGAIVTYTIRVYNEGEVDGYAKLIKDDIPEGLEFVIDNEINKEYRWTLLDNEGKETTDLAKATSVQTDYLSKDNEENNGDNLLKAFDQNTMESPNYKDVKLAFRVSNTNDYDRIIENKAQIAEDTDKDGNDVTDKDSTPDEWNEGEDDQDTEHVKVQYFDLSLQKWTTQTILIENGESTVTETGNTPENDPMVKVEIKNKKLNSVTVKFKFKIRVTNEGQIPGYAKEITDHIPAGLKFIEEDNNGWTQTDENTVTTDLAKDILLKPGESTDVEIILTWINGSDNLGEKRNVAEISEDYNEFNTPDRDSTPGNNVEGEDDQDDAKVILSIQTGEVQMYLLITGAVLIILLTGIILIKKFVL